MQPTISLASFAIGSADSSLHLDAEWPSTQQTTTTRSKQFAVGQGRYQTCMSCAAMTLLFSTQDRDLTAGRLLLLHIETQSIPLQCKGLSIICSSFRYTKVAHAALFL